MDWSVVGQALLNLLPTLVIAVAVIVGLYLNAKWAKSTSTADQKKKDILGYTIMAVKTAEKILPDDSKNTWVAKADLALKTFIENYTKYEGVAPSDATKAMFIQLKEQVLLEIDKVKAAKVAVVTTPVAPVAPVVVTPASVVEVK